MANFANAYMRHEGMAIHYNVSLFNNTSRFNRNRGPNFGRGLIAPSIDSYLTGMPGPEGKRPAAGKALGDHIRLFQMAEDWKVRTIKHDIKTKIKLGKHQGIRLKSGLSTAKSTLDTRRQQRTQKEIKFPKQNAVKLRRPAS